MVFRKGLRSETEVPLHLLTMRYPRRVQGFLLRPVLLPQGAGFSQKKEGTCSQAEKDASPGKGSFVGRSVGLYALGSVRPAQGTRTRRTHTHHLRDPDTEENSAPPEWTEDEPVLRWRHPDPGFRDHPPGSRWTRGQTDPCCQQGGLGTCVKQGA